MRQGYNKIQRLLIPDPIEGRRVEVSSADLFRLHALEIGELGVQVVIPGDAVVTSFASTLWKSESLVFRLCDTWGCGGGRLHALEIGELWKSVIPGDVVVARENI